jgi:hypothetical protein
VSRFEMSSNVARDASVETKQNPWPSSTLSSGIFSGGTDPVENVFRHNLLAERPSALETSGVSMRGATSHSKRKRIWLRLDVSLEVPLHATPA